MPKRRAETRRVLPTRVMRGRLEFDEAEPEQFTDGFGGEPAAGVVVEQRVGLGVLAPVVVVQVPQARPRHAAHGAGLQRAIGDLGVNADGLLRAERHPTIAKTRIIGGHQQMMRLDQEDRAQYSETDMQNLLATAHPLPTGGAVRFGGGRRVIDVATRRDRGARTAAAPAAVGVSEP